MQQDLLNLQILFFNDEKERRNPSLNTDNLSLFHRRLIVAITLSAAFLSVLTQFMLITAFPKIMIDFKVNSTQVQWLTTGYMITMAILIPITAFFIDRFKTRTLIM